MSFFTNVGIFVTVVFALALIYLIVLLVKDFIGYQKGARNMRDYAYSGNKMSELFWTLYGIKTWARSFRRGGGWFFTVGDPEDDNYDLRIYENGKIVRERNRYAG